MRALIFNSLFVDDAKIRIVEIVVCFEGGEAVVLDDIIRCSVRWVYLEFLASLYNVLAFVFNQCRLAMGVDVRNNVEEDEVLFALWNTSHRAVDRRTCSLVPRKASRMLLIFVVLFESSRDLLLVDD